MAETNKLSREQREELSRRVRRGDAYAAIARDLGITVPGVSFHARKLVGPKETRKISPAQSAEIALRFQAGERATDLANEFGVGLTTIRSHLEQQTGCKPGRHRRAPGVSPPLSLTDRVYLAALVDSEGCISHTRSQEHEGWQVSITNTSEELRASLAGLGGRFYFPKRQESSIEGKGFRNQVWVWRIAAAWDVHRFLVSIEPFMRIKREKAIRTITEIETKFGKPPQLRGGKLSDAAVVLDEAFRSALHAVLDRPQVQPPLRAGQLPLAF